jgi:hypothetical protein
MYTLKSVYKFIHVRFTTNLEEKPESTDFGLKCIYFLCVYNLLMRKKQYTRRILEQKHQENEKLSDFGLEFKNVTISSETQPKKKKKEYKMKHSRLRKLDNVVIRVT